MNKEKIKVIGITTLVMLLLLSIIGVSTYFATNGFKDITKPETTKKVETISLNNWTNNIESLAYYENSCQVEPKEYKDEILPIYQKKVDDKSLVFDKDASKIKLKLNIYENGVQTKIVNSDLYYFNIKWQPEAEPVHMAYLNTHALMGKLGLDYDMAYSTYAKKYEKQLFGDNNHSLGVKVGELKQYVHIIDRFSTVNPATSGEDSLFKMIEFSSAPHISGSVTDFADIATEPLELNIYFSNNVSDFVNKPDYANKTNVAK